MRSAAASRPDPAHLRRRLDRLAWRLGQRHRQLRGSRLGRRLARRRAGALLLALVLGWSVAHQVAAARAAQRSWGRTVAVLVTTRPVEAGGVLDSTSTEVRRVPGRFVPDGAIDALPSAGGRSAVELRRGEMLVAARVRAGRGATAASLPKGTQAVTVALGEPPAAVRRGDRVDAYAVAVADLVVADGAATATASRLVAHEAEVLAVTGSTAVLAVRTDEVADTVGAQAQARLGLVVVG